MRKVNFNRFDLNLVRVFVAMWEVRSVTGAAERLNLSQPAVSHALNRLRVQFDDPLFSRAGKTMDPTTVARSLYGPFKSCLEGLREATSSFDTFDPERSERTFRIAMSDVGETFFLPRLSAHVVAHAPHVHLRSVQLDATQIEAQLRSGQVDVTLGFLPSLAGEEFEETILFQDRFQCILSYDHPLKVDQVSIEEIQQLAFVEVADNATGFEKFKALSE